MPLRFSSRGNGLGPGFFPLRLRVSASGYSYYIAAPQGLSIREMRQFYASARMEIRAPNSDMIRAEFFDRRLIQFYTIAVSTFSRVCMT